MAQPAERFQPRIPFFFAECFPAALRATVAICPGAARVILTQFSFRSLCSTNPGRHGHPILSPVDSTLSKFRRPPHSSEHDVLRVSAGAGLLCPTRNLRATAQHIIEKHDGRFPKSLAAIQNLPGVGRYTANAVITFAFNQSVPVVEQTSRLLARLFTLQIPIDTSNGRETLWAACERIVAESGCRQIQRP